MSVEAPPLLTDLLKQVSRSFYLTLWVLPASVRPQIGLAYLLARTTDTIADTELVPVGQRLEALRMLRERILGRSNAPLNFGELARHQGLPAEKVILERVEEALSLLASHSPSDQALIRTVLDTITGGQELDLKRFEGASGDNIIALQEDAELDDYTYRVAGCVGEFWTKMCRVHVFPEAELDEQKLVAEGVRFGKGLQLVNILRDLPADLRQGRCYLPAEKLAGIGLTPKDLLIPENFRKLRPLYEEYIGWADAHLSAGWNYTNSLPRSCVRVTLACAWPVLIGRKTIDKLRMGNVLDSRERIKVSRAEVRSLMLRTVVLYPFRSIWLEIK